MLQEWSFLWGQNFVRVVFIPSLFSWPPVESGVYLNSWINLGMSAAPYRISNHIFRFRYQCSSHSALSINVMMRIKLKWWKIRKRIINYFHITAAYCRCVHDCFTEYLAGTVVQLLTFTFQGFDIAQWIKIIHLLNCSWVNSSCINSERLSNFCQTQVLFV